MMINKETMMMSNMAIMVMMMMMIDMVMITGTTMEEEKEESKKLSANTLYVYGIVPVQPGISVYHVTFFQATKLTHRHSIG